MKARHVGTILLIAGLPGACGLACTSSPCDHTGTCGSYVPPPGYCYDPTAPPWAQLYECADSSATGAGGGSGADAGDTAGGHTGADGSTEAAMADSGSEDARVDASQDGPSGDGGGEAGVGGGTPGAGGAALGSGGAGGAGGTEGAGGTQPEEDAEVPSDVRDAQSEQPATCDPDASPHTNPCVLAYGVFVSPNGNDNTNDGSKAHPFATLQKGLDASKSKNRRVYVCSPAADGGADAGAAGEFTDPVTIGADLDGVQMYGGYDCTTWKYVSARPTRLRTGPGTVPLKIMNVTGGVSVEDFEIVAADAVSPGGSSIAVLANTAENVRLHNVKILAGKGGDGQAGVDGAKGADGSAAGAAPVGAAALCPAGVASQNGGTWTMDSLCGSRGGNGGQAAIGYDGASGLHGKPRTNVTPPDVKNGGSEGGGDGGDGSPGNAGTAGTQAPKNGTFSITAPSYYTPAGPGGDGQGDGSPGQGGGGGGASNAEGVCIGASGGAGGMGGCGGTHGTGGKSGGASVALLSWNSTLTLDACTLVSSAGGAGGRGGNGGLGGRGQDGAVGGDAYSEDGGESVGAGGKGGRGGAGGAGGPGAGGNGGPSYAIAYKGTAPNLTSASTSTHGPGGAKGARGTAGSTSAPEAAEGNAQPTFPIP